MPVLLMLMEVDVTNVERRKTIMRRWGLQLPGGAGITTCEPTAIEKAFGVDHFPNDTGKVNFERWSFARQAADELVELGEEAQEPYECLRLTGGVRHFHLRNVERNRAWRRSFELPKPGDSA